LVKLNKIYTRTGDGGTAGLVDGSRVSKSSLRMTAIGEVDEANAAIGVAIAALQDQAVQLRLLDIGQHDVNAVACQRPTDAKPDAVGSTGHECCLSGKIPHRSTGIVFRLPASA